MAERRTTRSQPRLPNWTCCNYRLIRDVTLSSVHCAALIDTARKARGMRTPQWSPMFTTTATFGFSGC
jgi:hypothetical protein